MNSSAGSQKNFPLPRPDPPGLPRTTSPGRWRPGGDNTKGHSLPAPSRLQRLAVNAKPAPPAQNAVAVKNKNTIKNPTPYLKMRVLGAIDMAPGNTIRERIKAVSQMTFTDEDGQRRQFTWRTIETWLGRYHKHGVTALHNIARSDKGKTRKVKPEDILEAIRAVLPKVHGKTPTRALLYRLCIEEGVLTRSQLAPNTFGRLVKKYELLQPEDDGAHKHRLAFAKAHANEMWQADTLYGPHVQVDGSAIQTRLIAFLDDASRVCCHGQFFLAENVDTLIESLRAAFYKRGVPLSLYVDNGSIYSSKEIMGQARPLDPLANDRRPSPPATARQANPSTLKSEPSTEI